MSQSTEDERDLSTAREELTAYLEGRILLNDFCNATKRRWEAFESQYAQDETTDLSENLLWFYTSELNGLCQRTGDDTTIELLIRDILIKWKPHLERGPAAWRAAVASGSWPIEWE